MKKATVHAAALLFLFSAGIAAVQEGPSTAQPAPTAEELASAGKLFAASCSSCHQVPDLGFAVDRAWLTQVADTA